MTSCSVQHISKLFNIEIVVEYPVKLLITGTALSSFVLIMLSGIYKCILLNKIVTMPLS